jgi:phage terminase small subunit
MTRERKPEQHRSEGRRPPTGSLTPLQQRFVAEYLVDLNGTRAAVRAGYSERSASTMASRLLGRPAIAAVIAEGIDARAARARVTADRVIDEYARIAFSDMRRFVEWGPGGVSLRQSGCLTPEESASVAEVSETKTANGGTVKFKLHDKRAALDALAKHLGLFRDSRHPADAKPGDATVIVNIVAPEKGADEN